MRIGDDIIDPRGTSENGRECEGWYINKEHQTGPLHSILTFHPSLIILSSTMASILASATQAAHSAAASLLSAVQIKPGSTIPTSVSVKEDSPEHGFTLEGLTGKNVFVRIYLHLFAICTLMKS